MQERLDLTLAAHGDVGEPYARHDAALERVDDDRGYAPGHPRFLAHVRSSLYGPWMIALPSTKYKHVFPFRGASAAEGRSGRAPGRSLCPQKSPALPPGDRVGPFPCARAPLARYQLIFTIGLMRSRGFSSMTRKASSILSNPSKA